MQFDVLLLGTYDTVLLRLFSEYKPGGNRVPRQSFAREQKGFSRLCGDVREKLCLNILTQYWEETLGRKTGLNSGSTISWFYIFGPITQILWASLFKSVRQYVLQSVVLRPSGSNGSNFSVYSQYECWWILFPAGLTSLKQ